MGKNRLTRGTGLVGGLAVDATGTVTTPTAALTPTKTIASAASAKLDALKVAAATVTLTGTTHVTTAAGFNLATLAAPTLTDASAVTIDAAATLAITGAPIAAGSVTLTNAYALWVQGGKARFDGPLVATAVAVAALALDVTVGPVYTKSIAADSTFTASAVGTAGQMIWLIIATDGTQRVVTFGTNLNSSGTLTIPANKVGTITFVSDGTAFREVGRSINL